MTQLSQRFRLYLSYALARYLKLLTYFLQRARSAVYQTKTQAQHHLFALGKGGENLVYLLFQSYLRSGFLRCGRVLVGDKVA